MYFCNKTSSVTPITIQFPTPNTLSNRLKKVEILMEMNKIEDEIMRNGCNISVDLVEEMKERNSFNISDVEALEGLRI